jgi:hypothetical protein
MTRKLLYLIAILFSIKAQSQNPGLVISEVLANPAGTDSCKEYVELLATQNINFSLTPYTVIVNNNGTANANGWIASGALSYAFAINSGSIAAGSVAYVGGSCMTPTTGTFLRLLNVKYVNGDWNIGSPNAGGVFGNGGGNADGVAVFNLPVSSITSSTVPTDALFFGTGIGSASVNAGIDGYQLPVNDYYSGGKLNSSSFLAPDPGSDLIITNSGMFNLATNTWSINRTISTGSITTDGISTVSLSTSGTVSPATIAFVSNDTTAMESSSSANIFIRVSAASTASSSISVYATAFSNASATDYTLGSTTFTFPANAPVNSTAAISININNDAIAESAEYIILRFFNPQNASIGSIQQCAFYIADNDKVIPAPSNALTLNLLSSFSNTISGSNSAEIVAHDPSTQRLYIANSIGGKLDIINFSNPSSPSMLLSVPITTYGNINSVAVRNGIVACAMEGTNPQDSGRVVFFNSNGVFVNQVKVGMMPDMITFNQAGTRVLTANEGEPNATYSVDPDGSISIINISGGIANLTQTNVAHITFTAYNGQESTLRAQGIRIFGLNANASKDFEPEYITVSKDDSKAWVTLQENNAIVEINLTTNTITNIRAMGTKNHATLDNGMDISNVTKGINISNFPVKGFYLPDAIASYTVGGVNYYITANEGDTRDYPSGAYTEELRIGSANLDPGKFPFANQMRNNSVMGRLIVSNKNGDTDNDGDLDTLYSIGARSFSIWNANTGNLVYDSKDDMELITANNSYSVIFNASNANNTRKDRSDDKGPEPEGVALGQIGSNTYAFIAVERIGGVIVYDVTNPATPTFVTYVNNRNLATLGGDRGAEGIIFIPQSESPNGQHIVIAANEISSSLSIWGIPGCTSPLSSSLSVSGSTNAACSNIPPVLSVPSNSAASFLWSVNGNTISSATSNTYAALTSGNYSVSISTGTNCSTRSIVQTLTVNPTPTLLLSGSNTLCSGASVSQTISGAASYSWNTGATSSVVALSPSATAVYTITGTTSNSCTSQLINTITVNTTPTIVLSNTNLTICAGQSASVSASGASTYSWSNSTSNATLLVSPTSNTNFVVFGVASNSCIGTNTLSVNVNTVPLLSISGGTAICSGSSVTQTVSGANSYSWSTGVTNSVVNLSPTVTTVYTVTGVTTNTCNSIFTSTVVVNPLPNIQFSPSTLAICTGQTGTVTALGASNYTWSNGTIGSTLSLSPSASTVLSVLGTSSANCSSTNTLAVNLNTLPVVSISGNSAVCVGSAISQTVSGANNYFWNIGTNNTVITISPTVTTVYTATGTTNNNCSSIVSKTIVVNPLPNLNIVSTKTNICAGESNTLNASGANSYNWNNGSTSNSIVISPLNNTIYSVLGASANNCTVSSSISQSVSACTGISGTAMSETEYMLYPNPAKNHFTISYQDSFIIELSMYNVLGEVVLNQNNYSGEPISIEGLNKGVYFITITEGKNHSVKKLIIE